MRDPSNKSIYITFIQSALRFASFFPNTHSHQWQRTSMQGLIIRGTGVSAQGHSDVKNSRNRGFWTASPVISGSTHSAWTRSVTRGGIRSWSRQTADVHVWRYQFTILKAVFTLTAKVSRTLKCRKDETRWSDVNWLSPFQICYNGNNIKRHPAKIKQLYVIWGIMIMNHLHVLKVFTLK